MGVVVTIISITLLSMSGLITSLLDVCKPSINNLEGTCYKDYTFIQKINKCIKISSIRRPWNWKERLPCEGGHYMRIVSLKEYKAILEFINENSRGKKDKLFISLREIEKGQFMWMSDNTTFYMKRDFHAFNLKRFRRRSTSQKCASLDSNNHYIWHLIYCNNIYGRGLCETPPLYTPSKPIIDLIGRSDYNFTPGDRIAFNCTAFNSDQHVLTIDWYVEDTNKIEHYIPDSKTLFGHSFSAFFFLRDFSHCWRQHRIRVEMVLSESMHGKSIICRSKRVSGVPCTDEDIYCTKLALNIQLNTTEEIPGGNGIDGGKPDGNGNGIDGYKEFFCPRCWWEELWKILREFWPIFLLLLLLLLLSRYLCAAKKRDAIASEEESGGIDRLAKADTASFPSSIEVDPSPQEDDHEGQGYRKQGARMSRVDPPGIMKKALPSDIAPSEKSTKSSKSIASRSTK